MSSRAGAGVHEEVGSQRPEFLAPLVIVVLVLLQIALVWSVPQIPTTDGPAHKFSAWVFRELADDTASPLGRFFENRDSWLYANASYSFFLVRMSRWLTLDQAEKTAFSLYLILLPLAFGFFVRTSGNHSWLPLLILLSLSMNFLFFMGFLNFLWGLPFALTGIGIAKLYLEKPSLRLAILCNLALMLTFWSHVVSFGFALLAIGAVSVFSGFRGLLSGVATWLPSAGVAVLLWPHSARVATDWKYESSVLERLWKVLSGRVAVSFGAIEIPVAAITACLLLGLIVGYGARKALRAGGLWLVALAGLVLLLAIMVPEGAGAGSFIDTRFALFFWLLAMALIRAPPGRIEKTAAALAVVLSVSQLAYLREVFHRFNDDYATFISGADHIPSGADVFVWGFKGQGGTTAVWPFGHAASQYSLRLGSPNYFHYQADTRHSGHFPVRYSVAGLSRYVGERDIERIPPSWVAPFVEYGVVWGDNPDLATLLTESFEFEVIFQNGALTVLRQGGPVLEKVLEDLTHNRGDSRRELLTDWLLGDIGLERQALENDTGVAVNFTSDRWTHGVRPAAIVVVNDENVAQVPVLRVHCHATDRELPLQLFIEDGDKVHRTEFARRRAKTIELASVPAMSQRLFILWTDKAWSPNVLSYTPRWLGVRYLGVELVPQSGL